MLGLLALHRQARAQDVLAPTPAPPDQTPPAIQQANPMDVFAAPPTEETQPFQWEGLTLRPHPFYQFLSADGILVSTNRPVSSTIQTVAAGALLDIGDHWTLDYSPTWTMYSNPELPDTFGESVRLAGGTTYNDWTFGFAQGYADFSSPSSATASQVRQENYATAVSASVILNSKLSLDLALNQTVVSADQFTSYREWSTLDWLNYQFWPRLNVALGAGAGYDSEDVGPDMTFEQFQGRANWRATDKISFQLHGGAEVRQFVSGSAGSLVSPVFDATLQYQPFDHTQISLTGQSSVSATYLQDQVIQSTGVGASLNQRFLGWLFLTVSGGYQELKYVSSLDAASNRRDDQYNLNVQLSRSFLKRGTFAVIYQISGDSSSSAGYSFTSHQVGFQASFSY